jgi:hypothetical protein
LGETLDYLADFVVGVGEMPFQHFGEPQENRNTLRTLSGDNIAVHALRIGMPALPSLLLIPLERETIGGL